MAITEIDNLAEYCSGTSGIVIEYQDPDRTIPNEEYTWESHVFDVAPVKVIREESAPLLIESLAIAPGGTVATVNTLTLNTFYTVVVSGVIILSPDQIADGCFFTDGQGGIFPSNRLLTDDEIFGNVFFESAEKRLVQYDPLTHIYSVGIVGNDAPISFILASGGTGNLMIEIYENEYSLSVVQPTEPPTILFSAIRNKPFLNLNLACGGSCPTRTSFSCECKGDRQCYWDNQKGIITKIFEGSANG